MCIRGYKTNKEIILADILRIKSLEEFAEHDVVITGGEPTLCTDFIPIVTFLKDKCSSISICTNGTTNDYITKEFFGCINNIQISIDGTKDLHDAIRGKGSFQRILTTISKLESLKIPYTVSSVVNRHNASCMKDLADFLEQFNMIRYWNISYEMPFGYANMNDIMSTEEWNAFVDEMLDYVSFRMKIQKMFPFELFDKNKEKLDELFNGRNFYNCGSGRDKVYVYPDMSVYPCTCLTDFCLGSLKESSLSQILHNTKVQSFANYSVLPESKCNSCEYLKYCNGGCIGMSYHFFNKLGCGDIRCPKFK